MTKSKKPEPFLEDLIRIGLDMISNPGQRLDEDNPEFKEAIQSGKLTGDLDRIITDKENARLQIRKRFTFILDWGPAEDSPTRNSKLAFEFKTGTAKQHPQIALLTPYLISTDRNLIYRLERCLHCGWYFLGKNESNENRVFCPSYIKIKERIGVRKEKRTCRQLCFWKGCHPKNLTVPQPQRSEELASVVE